MYFNYHSLSIKIDMQFSMDFFNKPSIWLFWHKKNVSFVGYKRKNIYYFMNLFQISILKFEFLHNEFNPCSAELLSYHIFP